MVTECLDSYAESKVPAPSSIYSTAFSEVEEVKRSPFQDSKVAALPVTFMVSVRVTRLMVSFRPYVASSYDLSKAVCV